MLHRNATLGDRHGIENWQYADSTARATAADLVTADVGRIAYQLDDSTYWRLTATTPTWERVGVVASELGTLPQNSQSADYTCVLADAGKHLLHPSADTSARTFTIPANASVAYTIGTTLTFVNQNGAGVLTIALTSDTMRLAGAGTTGGRTLAANGIATAIKITSTEWIINGAGLT